MDEVKDRDDSARAVAPMHRAGPALTILNKQNGKWVLARDANLLTVQK